MIHNFFFINIYTSFMFYYSHNSFLKPCKILSPFDQLKILNNKLNDKKYVNIEENEIRINYYLNEVRSDNFNI